MTVKLALSNIKKSFRDYTIYFLTLTVSVCIFYLFNALDSQASMLMLTESKMAVVHSLAESIRVLSVFIAIVLAFLIIYANNFLIRRRKKELGIYMTLGMDRGRISRILVCETFFVGIISLIVGLLLGIFLSQAFSVVTAKMFEADMKAFHFTFSPTAFLLTLLCFGIMYAVVMIFNVRMVSKCKLITLLDGERQSQMAHLRKLPACIVLLIIGATLIIGSYSFVMKLGLQGLMQNLLFLVVALAVCFFGTLCFYMAIAGLYARLSSRGKGYFKGLNAFSIRQISSKINSNYWTMTMTSCMIAVMMVSMSSGAVVNSAMQEDLRAKLPVDMTISAYYPGENEGIIKELANEGIYLEDYADKCIATKRYYVEIEISDESLTDEVMRECVNQMEIISLSDYNALMELQGKETLTLEDGYAAHVFYNDKKIMEPFYSGEVALNVNGYVLKSQFDYPVARAECNMRSFGGSLVVADDITQNIMQYEETANLMYKNGKESEDALQAIFNAKSDMAYDEDDAFYYTIPRYEEYDDSIGNRAVITFVTMYIAIVLLLAAALILALQQLTEAEDNRRRFVMISNLGADKRMTDAALFKQVATYFWAPLIMAISHGIIGLIATNDFIRQIGSLDAGAGIIAVAILMVIIYGGYFIATYLGCRTSVYR